MAACDNLVIWRDVPKGAKLSAKAAGDTTKFDAVVRIRCDDGSVTLWHRNDLVPGPASMTLPIPDSCTVNGTVTIFNDTEVTLNLSINDGVHSCTWSFTKTGQVKVEVLP
jgi:hypothetical protein